MLLYPSSTQERETLCHGQTPTRSLRVCLSQYLYQIMEHLETEEEELQQACLWLASLTGPGLFPFDIQYTPSLPPTPPWCEPLSGAPWRHGQLPLSKHLPAVSSLPGHRVPGSQPEEQSYQGRTQGGEIWLVCGKEGEREHVCVCVCVCMCVCVCLSVVIDRRGREVCYF